MSHAMRRFRAAAWVWVALGPTTAPTMLAAEPPGGARCAGDPHPAGFRTYEISAGAAPGRYLLFVPRSYEGTTPVPVIFDFHGSGSDPWEELRLSGMDAVAERYGFVLLLPFARVPFATGGYTWNTPAVGGRPDDVRLVAEILEDVRRRVCVESGRVYLTGFSGGARLASRVACALSDRVAAAALVGGVRAPEGCGKASIPVLAVHGTEDPINPYDGGGPPYWGHGVDSAMAGWVAQNGCRRAPREVRRSPQIMERSFPDCRDGSTVVMYRVLGGGHTWPGSGLELPRERFGRATDELEVTLVIGEFFAAHR
ncbi:MAG TPA: PHB depolymerase family esterase [Gemmatimonadales bacterium]